MCKSGASHLPRAEEQGNVNIFSPRVEGIHNLAVSSGTLILLLILIVVYVLIKTGVMTCCGRNNRNTVQMQQMDREDEQKRVREEIPSHRVDMLPVHQVAALMNTKKVSHWNPDTSVPKFLLPEPKKLDFGPKNGQIWPKTGILGQISAFLAHLI